MTCTHDNVNVTRDATRRTVRTYCLDCFASGPDATYPVLLAPRAA